MYRRSSPYGSIALDLNNLGAYGGAYSGLPYSGYPAQSMWGQTQTGNLAWGSTGAYPYGYNNTATGNQTATGQGIITLSSTAMQAILYKIQTGELQIGVNPQIAMQQPQSICISGVALNVGHYTTTIYGGNVFLYLNGTSRGYIMQF
ncbi:MAG: hypothetical protein EOP09_20845 [Proteobacteria bacterium]|nr:MAG: hypothetical protein EOP09_20845 [Pseudomonadota bacterium]